MGKVRATKKVYKKDDFEKAVQTSFTTFVDPVVEDDNDTVEELFRLYEKLFYDIPIEGPNRSHEYLIKKSSELIQITGNTDDIQPLLDEITNLREQLLLVNQELIETQTESIENAAN